MWVICWRKSAFATSQNTVCGTCGRRYCSIKSGKSGCVESNERGTRNAERGERIGLLRGEGRGCGLQEDRHGILQCRNPDHRHGCEKFRARHPTSIRDIEASVRLDLRFCG